MLRRTEKSHLAIEGVVLQFERADTVDISGQTVIQETQLSLLLSPRREFKIIFFFNEECPARKQLSGIQLFFKSVREEKTLRYLESLVGERGEGGRSIRPAAVGAGDSLAEVRLLREAIVIRGSRRFLWSGNIRKPCRS